MIRPPQGLNPNHRFSEMFTYPIGNNKHVDMGFLRSEGVDYLACSCDDWLKHRWCSHCKEQYAADYENTLYPTPLAVNIFVKPWLSVVVDAEITDSRFADINVMMRWKKVGGSYQPGLTMNIAQVWRPTLHDLRQEVMAFIASIAVGTLPPFKCASVLSHATGTDWTTQLDPLTPEGRIRYRDVFNILDTDVCATCDDMTYIPDI